MDQFILRYTGDGRMPQADLQRLRELDGLRILEESGRMVLCELAPKKIDELAGQFPGWISSPVRHDIEIPDQGQAPKKPPRK